MHTHLFARFCLFLLAFCMHVSALWGQQAHLEVNRFTGFNEKATFSYVEINMGLDAQGIPFEKAEKGWQRNMEVQLRLYSLPDSTPILNATQTLNTPTVSDTTVKQELMRLQLRKELLEGNYGATLRVKGLHPNKPTTSTEVRHFFYINRWEKSQVHLSDVTFLAKSPTANESNPTQFTKLGYDCHPLANGGLFSPDDTLHFWAEVYGAQVAFSHPFHVLFQITNAQTNEPIAGTIRRMTFRKLEELHVVMGSLPLAGLVEGKYTLNLQVLSSAGNHVLSRNLKFIISKPIEELDSELASQEYADLYGYSAEQLDELIPQLHPISNKLEIEFARSLRTHAQKQNYFVSFWRKRALQNGTLPREEAQLYLNRLTYANQHYRVGKRPGWQTDRGRVLLEYGPPDEVQRGELEAEMMTHEIWNYNQLRTQANVQFVFADVENTGNHLRLIHCNLVGEVFNANWRQNLVRTNQNFAPRYDVTNPRGDNPANTMRID